MAAEFRVKQVAAAHSRELTHSFFHIFTHSGSYVLSFIPVHLFIHSFDGSRSGHQCLEMQDVNKLCGY